MSIEEFSDAFKSRIFTKFTGLKRSDREVAIQLQDTDTLRKKFESAGSGASAVFNTSGMKSVMGNIANSIEDARLFNYAESIIKGINYNNFIKYVEQEIVTTKAGVLTDLGSGAFRISNVPQATLRKYFLEYISIVIELDGGPLGPKLLDYISHHTQSGHLAGVFSLKVLHSLGLQATQTGSSYRDFTISSNGQSNKTEETLEVILKGLLDADYLTSNVVDREDIFLNATKAVLSSNPHLEVEIQFKKDNEASGSLLKSAGAALNKVLKQITNKSSMNNKDADDAFKQFAASLQPLVTLLEKQAKNINSAPSINAEVAKGIISNNTKLRSLVDDLINVKGSPSLLESLVITMASTIEGRKTKEIVTKTTKKTKSSTKDPFSTKLNAVLKDISKHTANIKAKKNNKVIRVNPIRTTNGQFYSLAKLQVLLDAQLRDTVARNMGTGTDHRVLNYRSGRFADSAKVERLSASREGMITAFYTYMKNPYQTFEPSYKQGSPKTRDPKLLIGKSIKEIAATMVGNRLRAVLV